MSAQALVFEAKELILYITMANTRYREAKDLICRLMVIDPSKRMGVNEILRHAWIIGSAKTHPDPVPRNIEPYPRNKKIRISRHRRRHVYWAGMGVPVLAEAVILSTGTSMPA